MEKFRGRFGKMECLLHTKWNPFWRGVPVFSKWPPKFRGNFMLGTMPSNYTKKNVRVGLYGSINQWEDELGWVGCNINKWLNGHNTNHTQSKPIGGQVGLLGALTSE
jgi:hypothetical protein